MTSNFYNDIGSNVFLRPQQKTRRVQAAGVTKNNYIKYPTAKLIRLAADSVQVKRLANSNTLGLVARAGE